MSTLKLHTQIDAAPQEVFDVLTDIPRMGERIGGVVNIEMLTDGPVGVGTRFKETRIMFKREAAEEFEVTEMAPPARLVLVAESCGCRYVCTHRLAPEAEGTRLELEMQITPLGLVARLMSPLNFLMAGTMKKAIQQDLDDLKAAVESAKAR